MIGPYARHTTVQGGGSARVTPHYEVSVLDGIEARAAAAGVEVVHARGCASHSGVPLAERAWLQPRLGRRARGLTAEFWNGLDAEGAPARVRRARRLEFVWFGALRAGVDAAHVLRAPHRAAHGPGERPLHALARDRVGRARLLLDGRVVVDAWEG